MLIEQRGGKRDSERQRQREVDRKIEREREGVEYIKNGQTDKWIYRTNKGK